MADTIIERGYLEDEYLENPYASGGIDHHISMQANMVINKQKEIGMQSLQSIVKAKETGMQAAQTSHAEHEVGMQATQDVFQMLETGMQANMFVRAMQLLSMQVHAILRINDPVGLQASMFTDGDTPTGMQAAQIQADTTHTMGMEAKHDTLRHAMIDYYLVEGGYLEEPYLVDRFGAFLGMQAEMIRVTDRVIGFQAECIIRADKDISMQVHMTVRKEVDLGFQANMFSASMYGMQSTMVIYNTTELRIMYNFPSRGTAGLAGANWSSTSTAPGDFSANNLNTDIVEQVFKSQTTSFSLTVDTGIPQGVPLDTLAILNHTLTRGGRVQVDGSQDNFATAPRISFVMTTELLNMFYIAPTFPTSIGQNRYWKFTIQDDTNPAGYVQIGTILFGPSRIFTVAEGFISPLTQGFRHYKDVIPTEGFTNDSNDRALKKFIRLTFKDLKYLRGNYKMLEDMMKYVRTSLKVLVIPTPKYASRFAIFAKLVTLPEISHNSIGVLEEYIDFSLEFDESL